MDKISFKTKDGVELKANLFSAEGERGIILLHQYSRDKFSWGDLPAELALAGLSALALDLRGHGESRVKVAGGESDNLDYRKFIDSDFYPAMMSDIDAARSELEALNKRRLCILGASIGANLALNAFADELDERAEEGMPGRSQIEQVICLSPGLDYHGIKTEETARRLLSCLVRGAEKGKLAAGAPRVLFAASSDDAYSFKSARKLYETLGPKHSQFVVLSRAGHGSDMFSGNSSLRQEVINFLKG